MDDQALERVLTRLPEGASEEDGHRRVMRAVEHGRVPGAYLALAVIVLAAALALLFPAGETGQALWNLFQAVLGLMPVHLAIAATALSLLAMEIINRN